ncbi:MAG: nuclear transport factor 2 family protein [Chloroflexota bacterium]
MTDEEGIRRTLARYCQLLDGRRFHEWSQLFVEDATWNGNRTRTAIFESISKGALAAHPELRRKHVCTDIVISVEGAAAHAESDFIMYDAVNPADAWHVAAWGKYFDRLLKRDGSWLFSERELVSSSN